MSNSVQNSEAQDKLYTSVSNWTPDFQARRNTSDTADNKHIKKEEKNTMKTRTFLNIRD